MKNLFILILLLSTSFSFCAAQSPDYFMVIYAGSNAPWGKNQSFTIDANGNCKYILTEVGKGAIDSNLFTITKTELQELSDQVKQSKFYTLKKGYNTNSVDGTSIYIKVTQSDKSKEVSVVNTHIPEVDALVDKLNTIISTQQIKIKY